MRFTFLTLALLSSVAYGQRVSYPADMAGLKTVSPDYVALMSATGERISPWTKVPSANHAEAPSWKMAFDSMSTNMVSWTSYSNFYGVGTSPRHFGLAKKTFMAANDMNLNSGVALGLARRVRIGLVWQPDSGAKDLVIKVFTAKTCDVDPSANGPAYGVPYSGVLLKKLAQAPASTLVVDADLSLLAGGVPLPGANGGAVVTGFGTTNGSGEFAEIPVGNWAAQPLMSNMTSPGEAYFPGTNPSSSSEYNWEDDSANSPVILQPNYFFEDYTNTTLNGFTPYAEQYSNDTGSTASGGILQPSVGLFVDQNMRTISGTIGLADYGTTSTVPYTATISIEDMSTNAVLQVMEVPLSSSRGYTVPDPRPTTGGLYRVSVKVSHWLRKAFSSVSTTAGNTTFNLTLPTNGDVNNDNVIDIADYTGLAFAFDSTSTDADWFVADANGLRPFDSDLNGDGLVDIADYTILALHFDGVGD